MGEREGVPRSRQPESPLQADRLPDEVALAIRTAASPRPATRRSPQRKRRSRPAPPRAAADGGLRAARRRVREAPRSWSDPVVVLPLRGEATAGPATLAGDEALRRADVRRGEGRRLNLAERLGDSSQYPRSTDSRADRRCLRICL